MRPSREATTSSSRVSPSTQKTPPRNRRAPVTASGMVTSGCREPTRGCGARISRPRDPATWATTVSASTRRRAAQAAMASSGTHSRTRSAAAASTSSWCTRVTRCVALSALAKDVPARPAPAIKMFMKAIRSSPEGAVRLKQRLECTQNAHRTVSAAQDVVVDEVLTQFTQRDQHEITLEHPWVGQREFVVVADDTVHPDDVDVESSRSPADLARSLSGRLGGVGARQQIVWRGPRVHFDDEIPEVILRHSAHRLTAVHPRDATDFTLGHHVHALRQMSAAITPVGAQ